MNTVFGQTLYDQLGPLVDEDPDGVGAALCDIAGAMVQRLDEIVNDTDQGPGLSMLLDPARAPAQWLDWQSALYGVTLVVGSSEADQRAMISALPAQHRGTVAYMVSAIQSVLTGTKSVRVLERNGPDVTIVHSWDSVPGTWDSLGAATWDSLPALATKAYSLSVILRTAEVPDVAKATAQAILAKPGGLGMTVSVLSDFAWDASTGTWNAAGSTTWDQAVSVAL